MKTSPQKAALILINIIGCVISCQTLHAQTPNLVVNGDMEKTEDVKGTEAPSAWSVHSGKALLSAIAEPEGKILQIQLESDSKSSWIRSATIQVKPNTTYRLSLSLKGSGSAAPWTGIKVYESDGGWNPKDGNYLIQQAAPRKWQQKEATFTTRENTKWLYIGILIHGTDSNTLAFDNIVLRDEN